MVKLNAQVKIWVKQLEARGKMKEGLVDELLKAYKTTPEAEMTMYVTTKQNEYDDRHELNADDLMHVMENKYTARQGEPNFEEGRKEKDELLALEAMQHFTIEGIQEAIQKEL